MIYYAVVAKNTYVLADYQRYEGEFPVKFQQIINNSTASNKITTYTKNEHTYYLKHNLDGYAFGCLVLTGTPAELPMKFLEFLQAKTYGYMASIADNVSNSASSVLTKYIHDLVVFYLIFLL